MAERDRTSHLIDPRRVSVGLLKPSENDGGEGFVDLEGVNRVERKPGALEKLRVAGMIAVSIKIGSSPVSAKCVIAARGFKPRCAAIDSSAIRAAAEPSVTWLELPAVTLHRISGKRSSRDGDCSPPPSQIRTCVFLASGSSRGSTRGERRFCAC
jgi:hypothetical protein